MGKWLANDERNQTWSKLVLAQTNAENIAELAQRSTTYYEHSAYYASADLYREQTENSEVHTYDSDYVLDHSMDRYQPLTPKSALPVAIAQAIPVAAAATVARWDPPKWASMAAGYLSYISRA